MTSLDTFPEIEFKHNNNGIGFELLDIESLWQKKFEDHNPSEPHRVKFFTLIYFEKGSGKHCIDFEAYDFAPGTFIFVYPSQVHSWDFSNQPKGKIFVLSPTFVKQISANIKVPFNDKYVAVKNINSPVVRPNKETRENASNIMKCIYSIQNLDSPNTLIVMHLYLSLHLIIDGLRGDSLGSKLTHKQHKTFSSFVELINVSCYRVRDAAWYANQLNITYKTLNQLCKIALNQTAKQLINDFTIVEMKRSLAVEEQSIQKLAYDFGFEDVSNFNKYFKKQANITPRQFQKNYAI